MTTQEDVKGVIIQNIHLALPWLQCDKALDLADAILRGEAAQGVVIQVRPLHIKEDASKKICEYEPLIEVKDV